MKASFNLLLLCITMGSTVGAAHSVSAQTLKPVPATATAPTSKTMAESITTAASGAKLAEPDGDDTERNEASEIKVAADLALAALADGELKAVPLYEEYELIQWINTNRHLQQVRDKDDCQLVQDIEARAEVLRLPAYQFLWGDMLAWGVCVPQQSRRGVAMLWKSAQQGLPAALEQLGRYYYDGTLVQKNRERAAPLMQEAASLGFEKAQFTWAKWLLSGSGSPLDYPQAYLWLKEMVLEDQKQHQEAQRLSAALAARMPGHKVKELNHRLMY